MKLSESVPRLYTLRAMAARLRVSPSWLSQQASDGKIPAVAAGSDYLFSLVPTMQALGKMAETPVTSFSEGEVHHG